MLTATRIDFEILRMTMFKVKFGVQEKSIWVLEKSLKFVSEKGYSCLACTQTLVVEFHCPFPGRVAWYTIRNCFWKKLWKLLA